MRASPVPIGYPLLPIQARALAQRSERAHHRHLSPSAIEIGDQVVEPALIQAIDLWSRQDIFRLRVRNDAGEWRQFHERFDACRPVPIEEWTIESGEASGVAARLTDICWQLGERNDIVGGWPFQIALVRCEGRLRYLLWVVDHLLIDNATFFLLFNRLRAAYERVRARQAISFAADTAMFRWSSHLAQCAQDPRIVREYGFWRRQWPLRRPLPPAARRARSERGRVVSALTAEETSAVYRVIVREKIPFDELCLVHLLWAYRQTLRETRLRLCMLHSSRHSGAAGDLDLAEGCGWFVSMFPAVFDLRPDDRAAFLRGVRQQYARYRDRREHYGALRYLNADIGRRLAQQEDWSSTVVFNCLGEVTAPGASEDVLRVTPLCMRVHADFLARVDTIEYGPGSAGVPAHPRLACLGLIVDGKLHVAIEFERDRQDPAQMRALADAVRASLLTLIDRML